MLYALTKADGSVAIMTVLPKEITVAGVTMPVTLINAPEKYLEAQAEQLEVQPQDDEYVSSGGVRRFNLPTDDMRALEANSIPNATLVFYDVATEVAKLQDSYVASEKISVSDMPATRAYRDAWAVNGKSIGYNMPKARDIHRTKLREARKPMLEALDVAYQRADEQDDGPAKRRIAAEKQKLRDITANQLIERANNIAALETLTVDYLLAHP